MSLSQLSVERECPWCNAMVPVRRDGALRVHHWDVRRGGDVPVWAACVGSGTTPEDVEAAGGPATIHAESGSSS